jgi:hypothetical protein
MKKIGLYITLALGLSLTLVLLWVLGATNLPAAAAPVIEGGDWDGRGLSSPAVVSDVNGYHMWYDGRGFSFYWYGFAMGYASSADGLTWEKYAGNPILEPGDAGAWDDVYRGQSTVLADEGLYKMWYSGGSSSGPWQTGYATSTDGLAWNIYAGNPVLASGGPGSWDDTEADGPSVIKDGDTFKMWYFGCNADYSVCSIGYATSPDGITWTKYAGNPVLEQTPGAWDESGINWPRVIKNGATYQMWYVANSQIGLATSSDGIDWTKYAGNPVLSEGWDGGPVGPGTFLLEGETYKLWVRSGAGESYGIGYLESEDGIGWTQPVSNPVVRPGEAGVIIDANYDGNRVRGLTFADTPITITVSDGGGVKATIVGVTDEGGWYRSWEHNEDWDPGEPDILPGDTVAATTDAHSTIIETVGEIEAQAWIDADVVEGTVDAPWFAPDLLSVICEVWPDPDPSQLTVDRDVPADGGTYECDFSGLVDISGGMGGMAGYVEPDGDMVSADFAAPYMEAYYGYHDGAGGIYAPGHTFWITVTNHAGDFKASATVTTTSDGGWWGHGFRPWWSGGDCCDWSPPDPDIAPGDWVTFKSDDGYENAIRVGSIFGTVDVEANTMTGPIFAPWIDETLEVACHPQTMWPFVYRWSTAEPDASVPYYCEWSADVWDIEPADEVMVHYVEPDHDQVYRMMIAAGGAPSTMAWMYLPLLTR